MTVVGKLIGAAFITIAATLLGFSLSNKLKMRCETLNWYLQSVRIISDRIRYSSSELEKIVLELPAYKGYLGIQYPFCVKAQNTALNSDDAALINEFFSRLGMGDVTEQINICTMYAREIEARYNDAQKEYQEKSKPIKSFGFLTGLGVAIILI